MAPSAAPLRGEGDAEGAGVAAALVAQDRHERRVQRHHGRKINAGKCKFGREREVRFRVFAPLLRGGMSHAFTLFYLLDQHEKEKEREHRNKQFMLFCDKNLSLLAFCFSSFNITFYLLLIVLFVLLIIGVGKVVGQSAMLIVKKLLPTTQRWSFPAKPVCIYLGNDKHP